MISRFSVLASLAFASAACDDPGGGLADIDALPRITITRDLRIGSADDPDAGFSRIGSVAVDDEGSIYVFELADSKIRVYGRDGTFLRAIGGKGRGPGEFEYLRRFGVMGDTVWTIDIGLRRITLFDRSGTVLSTGTINGLTVQLQNQQMAGMVMPRAMRGDGLFTADMSMYISRRGQADNDVGAGDTVQVPRVLYDEPLDVMMSDGGFVVDRTFAPSAEPTSFGVTRLTESGDTVFAHRFTYTPHRYPEAVLDTFAWRSAGIPGGFYNPDTGPARTPEGVDIDAVRNSIRNAASSSCRAP
jgi:6-bladed beta-propeller